MKKLLLALIICMTSSAYAEVITVLQERVYGASNYSRVSTKFFMNTTTGEGSAVVTVTDQDRTYPDYPRYPGPVRCDRWGNCYPDGDRFPMPVPRTVVLLEKTIPVRNLNLVNKRMIYSGSNGNTDCGYLGTSRVLNVPTLYLNGNCSLRGNLRGDRLTVKLSVQ